MGKDSTLDIEMNYKILDSVADLVRVINTKNEVVYVNTAMSRMLGYDHDNGICSLKSHVFNPQITKRTIETGEIIQREEVIDGSFYLVKCSPILGNNNKIEGAVEVFRNTTIEKKLLDEITNKNKSSNIEMLRAQKIQESLLPMDDHFGSLSIDYLYRPANTISGDMFDLFKIDDDNIAIYISDTVGHGFASSMITMFVRVVMRNLQKSILKTPSKTLTEIWKRFCLLNLDVELYFTLFYAVYNLKTHKLTYSNAGHFPCPVHVKEDVVENLEVAGHPITRFLKNVNFEDQEIELKGSGKLMFMTDGVTETMNDRNEIFSIKRVKKILSANDEDELAILEDSLNKFMWGEQRDDITALLLKYDN